MSRALPCGLVLVLVLVLAAPAARAQERARRGPGGPGEPTPERLLAALDKDGDGKVSKEEFLREQFDRIDRNRDGLLDEGDRGRGEEGGGGARRRLRGADKDDDGRVSFAEYAAVAPGLERFQASDKDGSGFLERADLEAMAAGLAAERRRRLPDFVARFDADGDGRVARAEFPGPDHVFARLDADRDGAVTSRDALPARGAAEPLTSPPAPGETGTGAPPGTAPAEPAPPREREGRLL